MSASPRSRLLLESLRFRKLFFQFRYFVFLLLQDLIHPGDLHRQLDPILLQLLEYLRRVHVHALLST